MAFCEKGCMCMCMYVCMYVRIRNWPLPIGAFQDQCKQVMRVFLCVCVCEGRGSERELQTRYKGFEGPSYLLTMSIEKNRIFMVWITLTEVVLVDTIH